MKNILVKYLAAGLVTIVITGSCAKKLDLYPVNDLTPEKTYATVAGY